MFLFTHIEKCAGTTFNQMLSLTFLRYFHITKNHFGGNDIKNDLTDKQFKKILRYYPSGIGGHSIRPYLSLEKYLRNKPLKITFLREPTERYMSQYNHELESGFVSSFEEFLNKKYCNDFMTNKIAGLSDVTLAAKYLNNFDFIGDVNQYNKSINYLQDIMNIRFYSDKEDLNQRFNKEIYLKFENLSNEFKNRVYENNKNDILLYERFILNSNILNTYSDIVNYKQASDFRKKVVNRTEKFKKINIVNPLRKHKP